MATILITGTSTGIGLATALAFGRAGDKVAAAVRNPDRAPELADVASRENLDVAIFTMDVDDDVSVTRAADHVAKQVGPIDVLVNNAGIERVGSIEEVPLQDFRAVMETNYFGAIRCIQAVLPSMRQRRSGCIINIASISGRLASSPMGPYAASKIALEALSECLAQEVKPFNVRVAIVEPGIINTHPVGPDAAPFIAWRQAMTDEEWVTWGALDDDAWYARVKADFRIDARSEV